MKTIFVSAYRVPCHAVSKLRNCGCRHENNNNVTAFFELWMFLMFHQKFTKMWLTSTNRMSVHSSQSRDCLVSVRCVVADHYQAEPVAGLDPLVSDFTGYNIRKVPIIRWVMSLCPLEHISYHSNWAWRNNTSIPCVRVFGCTLAGQRSCLHVHGIFPYLYVPLPGHVARGDTGGWVTVIVILSCVIVCCRFWSVPGLPDGDIESGGCTDWRPASIVPSTSPWARLELVRELTRAN